MKVVLISGMYQKQGSVSGGYIHRQTLELQRTGVEVTVVCPQPRFAPAASLRACTMQAVARSRAVRMDGIRVNFLPYWNVPNRVSARFVVASLQASVGRFLSRLRTEFDFDLIHANRLFPQGFAATELADRFGVPVVVGVQGSDMHTHPLRSVAVARFTRRTIQTARLYAVSRDLARQVHAFAPPRAPVAVVHNGVDPEHFAPSASALTVRRGLGLPPLGLGIVTVCRLVAEKGIYELLDAFERLSANHPDAWLLVVGDGPLAGDLRARTQERGLAARVFLAGAQPNRLVGRWLNASDIFVLASYDEGLPNVVLEAMACALPVVATDVGGVAEAVINGTTGYLVPARNVRALERAVCLLAGDASLRRSMGRAGRERVHREFLWSRSAERLQSLYLEVLENRTSSAKVFR